MTIRGRAFWVSGRKGREAKLRRRALLLRNRRRPSSRDKAGECFFGRLVALVNDPLCLFDRLCLLWGGGHTAAAKRRGLAAHSLWAASCVRRDEISRQPQPFGPAQAEDAA